MLYARRGSSRSNPAEYFYPMPVTGLVQMVIEYDYDPLYRLTAAANSNIIENMSGYNETIINYTYDPLYRLTEANYSNGDYYHYTYDAIGNRLTQSNMVNGLSSVVDYVYDDANRLTSVNAVNYTWDANGNLLNDGTKTYTYDSANRLTVVSGQQLAVSYAYNGLGDRLQEVHNGGTTTFTMDLNAGLTQVLNDGTNNYIYGIGYIAQAEGTGTEYFLGDALGSVRQLTNTSGAITYASTYDPYGVTTQTYGASQTAYGFTGEYTSNDLVYLRARHYAPGMGRFLTRDTFEGDVNIPASLNRFNYAHSNPVMNTDPSGNCIFAGVDTVLCAALGGGIGGAITGAVIGGAYAKWMYHLAYTGKCGCEGQQIISQYTESQFIWKGAAMGAVFGAVFGALSATGAGGVAITALAGMGFSTYGITTSIQRIQADPHNECAWWDLGLSIFGLVASGYTLGKTVGQIGLPGGGPPPLGGISSQEGMVRVTQLRQQYKIGSSHNVAYVLEDVTTGSQGELFAASGKNTVKNFQVPANRQFTTSKIGGYDRYWDSEVMILEYVASKASPSDSGTIYLFSERPICASCSGVIQQFLSKFPNINVYFNSGL